MELYYKITPVILLLLHSSQMGCQNPTVTEPPAEYTTTDENSYSGDHTDIIQKKTINPEWLRILEPGSSGEGSGMEGQDQDNSTVTANVSVSAETTTITPTEADLSNHTTTLTPETNDTQGLSSNSTNSTTTAPSGQVNETETNVTQGSSSNTTDSTTTAPAGQVNETGAEEGRFSTDLSNDTTTLTPETTITQGPSSNSTTAEGPLINVESTTLSTTDLPPPETTTSSTTVVTDTPEAANMMDKNQGASGTNSERGSSGLAAPEPKRSRRTEAWSAILGTGVAVAFVAMVVYVIVRKRKQRDFSHRKLVEEFPSDPVLRLDNSEPLDLNFGGSAYYNRAMEADDIQMNSFSGGQQQ